MAHDNARALDARTHDRPLDAYFDDMASLERLGAEQEIELARDLADAKTHMWTLLLRAPRSIVRETLADCLGERAPTIPTAGACPEALATTLAAADRDGKACRALVTWIRAHPGRGNAMQLQAALNRVRSIRDRFVAANLGLVVSVARRYERRLFSFADLIQEGNAGLLKAVDRFDPDRGFRFSTYAVWWIRHAIGRALSDRGREIRLPVHVAERQQTLLRARTQFEAHHGRAATVTELAEATRFSAKRVKQLLEVEYTRATSHDPLSKTAQPVAVDDLPCEMPDYEDALDASTLARGLREAMDSLPDMQRSIIRQRFGLDGAPPMTLREVGQRYALSRERIRQIQVSALARIRESFEVRGLVA